MEFRQASEADFPDAFAVFVAAQTELHDRRGAPWPAREYDAAAALDSGLRPAADPGLLLLSPADHPPPTAPAIHSYWLY
jgi:hypothetical protein